MKSHISNLMYPAKSLLRYAIIICSTLFFLPQEAAATHIVGGDLTYQCLGSTPQGLLRYRLRLTVRRDCQFGAADAPFDNPAAIGLYDLTSGDAIPFGEIYIAYNGSDTLNEQLMSDCSVVSGPVCVETFVYDTIIELLPRPTGYIFVYQRCCRNQTINNVLNPLNTGMSLVAELTGQAQAECNSSPQFGLFPPVYTCVNEPISFDHSAIDPDGDSLVYELCTPLAGGTMSNPQPFSPFTGPPYEEIIFRPPYSLANVMGGVALQMDPNTGIITGTPNTIGQFVVGICVTAYKNGVMTGKTRRDFQFNVRQCRNVPTPAFTAPALDCEDLTVVFDNQSLLADEYLWIFDLDDPLSDTSTLFEPTYTYDQEGFYNVALVVNVLENGERFCIDTIVHQIGVFDSQIDAGFTYNVSSCTESIVLNVIDTSTGFSPDYPAETFEWLLTVGGDVYPSSSQNPTFEFEVEGIETACLTLVVTAENGCSATQTECFPVRQISLLFNPQSDSICFGTSTNILIGGDSTLDYEWDPETGLNLDEEWDPVASPEVSTTYFVTVTDGLCEVTGSVHVGVQQLPVLAFGYETDCKSLVVSFENNSTGNNFQWDFNTGNPSDTTNAENPTFTFPEPGIYDVVLNSRDGCDVSISHPVTVNVITEDLNDQVINCFEDGVFLNPGGDTTLSYIWSLPGLEGANPFASVNDDTEIFVTISDPALPNCPITDTITLVVPFDFSVSAGNNVTSCKFEEIILTASSNGDVDFEWFDGNNSLGGGESVTVEPSVTTTYTVVATDSLGCTKSANVTVNKPEPSFDVSATPAELAYCNIQTITLNAESTVGGVTFEWYNINDQLIGQLDSVDVTPGSPTSFIVIGTDVLGCEDSDTVTLTPTFFNLSITDDQSLCREETTQITVTDHNGQNLTHVWSPIEFVCAGAVTATATVCPVETTTFCDYVTNVTLGCVDTICSTITMNLFDPFPVVITADPPPPLILTQSTTLSVNQPVTYTYVWSSSNPNEQTPDPINNPVVTPLTNNTTYSVTVTNLDGCTETASITIAVDDPFCDESEIFLPNAFTPNGDGENDVLFVRGNFVSTMELHIYNRWGEEVFSSNDQSVGWDGRFKGERLAPDVFGYYMNIGCPNGKEFFMKGNITILE